MFTLFDLLQWTTALGVMIGGALVGHGKFGWPGAIGGGILGFIGGSVIGRIPWMISWGSYRLHLKRSSTEKLKAELKEQYFVSHLLIAELVVRGEPVEQFWPYILSQVESDSSDQRRFGWHNLNIWFPRLAKQVEGFDPHASTEACRERLKTIEEAEPDAAPLPSEGAPSGRKVSIDVGAREMKTELPSCVIDTTDGMRVCGMLFMRNERIVVLLNNLCEDADLGPLSSVRDCQIDPEADLYVIPADRVAEVTEFAS